MDNEQINNEREVRTLFEGMDQDLAIYIHAHAESIFDRYQKLGNLLSKMRIVRQGDVAKHYRKLFGQQKLQTRLLDMEAVCYLVRQFNGPHSINTAEDLKKLAKIVAGEAITELNEPIPPEEEIRKKTHDQTTDVSDWLVDQINSDQN